jgi:hypothetical protein
MINLWSSDKTKVFGLIGAMNCEMANIWEKLMKYKSIFSKVHLCRFGFVLLISVISSWGIGQREASTKGNMCCL